MSVLSNWNGSDPESGRGAIDGRRMRSVVDRVLRWLAMDSPRECLVVGAGEGSSGLGSPGMGGGGILLPLPLLCVLLFRHRLRRLRTDMIELDRDLRCFESSSTPCSESAEKRLD